MIIPESEIERIVWLTYPKDPEERTCIRKAHALNQLRQHLREKLRKYEPKAENRLLEHSQAENGSV